jgi:hypothetical protein
VWVDTIYTTEWAAARGNPTPTVVKFLSEDYFALLTQHPEIAEYLAVGDRLILVIGDIVYQIQP